MEAVCQLCGNGETTYRFKVFNSDLLSCPKCNLLFLRPHPGSNLLEEKKNGQKKLTPALKRELAGIYLREFFSAAHDSIQRVLVIGNHLEEFSTALRAQIKDVVEIPCWNQTVDGNFDACIVFDALERSRDINLFIRQVRDVLKDDGLLFLVTACMDAPRSSNGKSWWSDFHQDHLFYFNTQNLAAFLLKSGFHKILTFSDFKFHLSTQENFGRRNAMSTICRKTHLPHRKQKLSVIIPVYNERATFSAMMELLLKKKLPVEREIIIVESNSTDGTKEEVRRFEDNEQVIVIYEDKPSGKGHAVRTGLQKASGDIILIQDADLEYDVDDYDNLLEPLLRYECVFVLGSRHTGNWKMRKFGSKKLTAAYVNFGHILLTSVINQLHNSSLKDPFTMYKVFRRDCLYGLSLQSNGFDLDWELVIKLLRKKYFPVEIPVNYKSRSFSEGKKIHLLKDPLRGLRALKRYRFTKLDLRIE